MADDNFWTGYTSWRLLSGAYDERTIGSTWNLLCGSDTGYHRNLCIIYGRQYCIIKMLKKNKRYYYKANHFTAVSGMIYRMKQNAVGLANICILSTMVIVLVSMTVSLYAGMSDILAARFPSPAKIEIFSTNEEEEQQVKQILKKRQRRKM